MKKRAYELLFEDDYLLIINKSDNVLSIPDRYLPEKKNIQDLLKSKYERIFTLHRLDKDTSGIMLFAKTEEMHRSLSILFEDRKIEKKYLGIIKGHITPSVGTIEASLEFNKAKKKVVINKNGKESITHYTTLELFQGYCLVELVLETGRTHQIRAHLNYISKPLIVDSMYGYDEAFYLSSIKRKYNRSGEKERPLLARTPLHAHKIQFIHPKSKELIQVECTLPKDMRACLNQFRKWIPITQDHKTH